MHDRNSHLVIKNGNVLLASGILQKADVRVSL